MRRGLVLVGVTALLLAAQVVSPASACGCGGAAPEPGTEVAVDRETALVRWDGDREQIVMRLDMRSDAGATGLVVPTPNPATVTAGDPALFDALEGQTAPVHVTRYEWWGGGLFAGAGAPPEGGAPTVLDRVQLGPIEAVTLAASDTEGLRTWLHENGFAIPDALGAQLDPYVDEGWSFVALRLTAEAGFDGELDPITFTFDSDELVYPMRMSRAAETAQLVRLYVLDEHRAAVDADSATQYWAGPVTEPALAGLGAYLTVVDLTFTDPASQIDGDLVIARAADDTAAPRIITEREYVEVGGVPAGWFLVLLGFLLVMGGAVVAIILLAVRAARSR